MNGWMDKYKPHLLYPSVDGHLGCFHILVIVNSAAMNFGVHVIFQISIFIFFLIYIYTHTHTHTPKSGIAGSYGNSVVLEKTLESFLDCKEIKPVHPKGNQS